MSNLNKYIYSQYDDSYVIGVITIDYGSHFIYKALETNSVKPSNWVVVCKYYGFLDKTILADSLDQLNKLRVFQ
jgi:hypothetical protein